MSEQWKRVSALPDLRHVGRISLDLETNDEGLRARHGSAWPWSGGYICGVAVAYRAEGELRRHYFPIRHPDSDNFDREQVFSWLRDLFASGVSIVTQNGLYDFGWLRTEAGIVMPSSEQREEIGALATLIDENRYQYSLDALCAWRGLPGKDESALLEGCKALGLLPKRRKKFRPQEYLWQLPAHFVGPYAETDTANALALFESLNPILDQENTRDAYRLEVDLLPMVLEMRRRGIRIDTAAAERARDLLLQKRGAVFAEMSEKLGVVVGMTEIGRTKWLAETFDRQGITYPRTEKGNPSFTAGNSGWMPHHPHWLPQLIVKADKYNNAAVNFLETYVLGHVVNGRVHAEIHPHRSDEGGTRSLRFSYSSPPLQLMPAHDEELAPLIRGVFLPEEGEVWAKPDLSQQEFRFIVHYAARHKLSKAAEAVARYRNDPNTDFHALVSTMTGRDRQTSKATNFAKAFGAGVRKFAAMIGKSESEAEAIYNQYDRELPFVSQLSKLCEHAVRKNGYLTLYDGARRHWNEWAPGGPWKKGLGPCERDEAIRRTRDPNHPWYRKQLWRTDTRKAMNALIQGSAARHTKRWMRAVWREGITPLLQMHDALDCSVSSPEMAERVAQLGREAVKLEVPMEVDLKFGRTWGSAKSTWQELHATPEKPTRTFDRSPELEQEPEIAAAVSDDDISDAPLTLPAWQIDWAEALERDFPHVSPSAAAVEPSAPTAPERPLEALVTDTRPAKPQTYNGKLEQLPPALAHLQQKKVWLCWNWSWTGKKWTKVPKRTDNPSFNASTSNPATWGLHEQAVRQVCHGRADGIGFAVQGRNIGGVDLDHCRTPETGELAVWAGEYLSRFPGAYVEATVSGKGLRILGHSTVKGLAPKFKLPNHGNDAGVELFSNSNHFLTLSCNEIGSCTTLPEIGERMLQLATALGGATSQGGNGHDQRVGDGFDIEFLTPWSLDAEERLRSALDAIPTDEKLLVEMLGSSHDAWVKIGRAIERLDWGERGYAIFRDWSAQNTEKFNEKGLRTQWASFHRNRNARENPVTVGTVFYYAQLFGWEDTISNDAASPISPTPEPDYSIAENKPPPKNDPPPSSGNGSTPSGSYTPEPWPALDNAAFHGLAGEVVTRLMPHTESDPAALLLQYLACFGNAVGRGPYYQVEGDRHFTNLFVLLAGDTAKARKGTSAGRIRSILELADETWARERLQGGMSSGEGIIAAIRDPRFVTRKGNIELEDAGIDDKRLLLYEPEFSSVLTVLNREGNILSRVVRDAWDCQRLLATMTKHSPTRATDPHIAIVGHITIAELQRRLDETAMANGFANRFLVACVRRARLLPHGGNFQEDERQLLGARTAEALAAARTLTRIEMSSAARERWSAEYPELTKSGDNLTAYMTARGDAQTIRLALIYALLDQMPALDVVHLEAGLALWRFCRASAHYIFGEMTGDTTSDALLRALKTAGMNGMMKRDLFTLFSGNLSVGKIDAALSRLQVAGKVISREIRSGSAGRPRQMWFAVETK